MYDFFEELLKTTLSSKLSCFDVALVVFNVTVTVDVKPASESDRDRDCGLRAIPVSQSTFKFASQSARYLTLT